MVYGNDAQEFRPIASKFASGRFVFNDTRGHAHKLSDARFYAKRRHAFGRRATSDPTTTESPEDVVRWLRHLLLLVTADRRQARPPIIAESSPQPCGLRGDGVRIRDAHDPPHAHDMRVPMTSRRTWTSA